MHNADHIILQGLKKLHICKEKMVPPNILFIKVNESEKMVKMLDFTGKMALTLIW